jgi:hypothetical protein
MHYNSYVVSHVISDLTYIQHSYFYQLKPPLFVKWVKPPHFSDRLTYIMYCSRRQYSCNTTYVTLSNKIQSIINII